MSPTILTKASAGDLFAADFVVLLNPATPGTAPTFVSVATVAGAGSSNTLALNYPGSIAANNVNLCATVVANNQGFFNTSVPSGYHLLGHYGVHSNIQFAVDLWYKVLAGGESGTVTFTLNDSLAPNVMGNCIQYHGADATNPVANVIWVDHGYYGAQYHGVQSVGGSYPTNTLAVAFLIQSTGTEGTAITGANDGSPTSRVNTGSESTVIQIADIAF